MEAQEIAAHFPEWLQVVADGHEVVITHEAKPLAKLITAGIGHHTFASPLDAPPLRGAKVLTPNISSAEIAEEMWGGT